jgi:hypothetical protein
MNYEQKYLKYKAKYLELKNQIGGGAKEDVTAFAKEKGMSLVEFHEFLIAVNYYKKQNSKYDDKGIHNPMIIGDYVVRAIGHRTDLVLQARPKVATDTPEALLAMSDVTDNVYIDKENDSKYVTINHLSDY